MAPAPTCSSKRYCRPFVLGHLLEPQRRREALLVEQDARTELEHQVAQTRDARFHRLFGTRDRLATACSSVTCWDSVASRMPTAAHSLCPVVVDVLGDPAPLLLLRGHLVREQVASLLLVAAVLGDVQH